MKDEKSGLVYGIIIGVLAALVCFLIVYIISIKKDNEVQVNESNSGTKINETNTSNTSVEKISYEVESVDEFSYALKVNGKNINIELPTKPEISQLNDVLVVNVCTSGCNLYVVDKNGNLLQTSFTTKGSLITDARVEGNSLYISSQTVCASCSKEEKCEDINRSKTNNTAVKFEEKYTYSNGKFNEPTIFKSVSATEYEKQMNLNCN